jgi:hypothetical protein
MTVTKTHFAYRIDRWDADGNSIMEHVAGCDDLTVAVAAHVCRRKAVGRRGHRSATQRSRDRE